ncbi:MAG TPA: shikimate kinase [Candidatus Binatia bacterium]|nr:shikimate kinase [Candidatus Binatia bacterium]
MAVGKSAVGRNLAKRLHKHFVDLDRMIEKRAGLKVREIFDAKGETYFRELEKQTLADVLKLPGHVIATGGGVVMDEENLRLLREKTLLVCLIASTDAILARVGNGTKRPLLKGPNRRERVEELLKQRANKYAQAHIIVDTSQLTLQQVVDQIVSAVESYH